ncbi:hypothetical protein ACQQ2N_04355 [Dokdonella sp. MW10]|uniref:hypothetical protein n=1 Tax=Dokdonella sp. MW10 TaxID=2992926 RepID=UPI003F7F4F16
MPHVHVTSFFRALAVLSCLVAGGVAHAAGLTLTMSPVPPVYTGTQYTFGLGFEKTDRNDGIVHDGPFTLRIRIPAGMTLRGATGGNWTCPPPPAGAITMSCTYPTALTFWNPASSFLSVHGDTPIDMPLGPVDLEATIESAQVPLPGNVICTGSPSTTGCAIVATPVTASSLRITDWGASSGWVANTPVAVWNGPPYEAGTDETIVIGLRNIGFSSSNTPITLRVMLPDGVSFRSTGSSIPTFTCSAAGQLVTCTTPHMYDTQNGYVVIGTRVSHGVAVPGPLFFHAAVGNNVVAPPSDCVANPHQDRCGRLQMPTRAPRTPFLRFETPAITHSPAIFTLGQDQGPIVASFRNVGDGLAGATSVLFKLPPGFIYTHLFSAIPSMACSASGSIANGQVLTCTGPGLPSGTSGYVSFGVHPDAGTEAPGPVVLLGAVDTSSPASTQTLASCANDPTRVQCAWHEIPTFRPCALQYGTDGVYCDAFETVMPQR